MPGLTAPDAVERCDRYGERFGQIAHDPQRHKIGSMRPSVHKMRFWPAGRILWPRIGQNPAFPGHGMRFSPPARILCPAAADHARPSTSCVPPPLTMPAINVLCLSVVPVSICRRLHSAATVLCLAAADDASRRCSVSSGCRMSGCPDCLVWVTVRSSCTDNGRAGFR